MPVGLLDLFKYILIALIWLFFLRVLRAVWVQVRNTETPRSLKADVSVAASSAVSESPSTLFVKDTKNQSNADKVRGASKDSLRIKLSANAYHKQEIFEISGIGTIGRSSGCTIPLGSDEFGSSVHARLYGTNGIFYIEDLGSTNGTYINGAKVTTSTRLAIGDVISIGRSTMEVVS